MKRVDRLFLILSQIGPSEDVSFRRRNAELFFSGWLTVFCYCIFSLVDHWLFPAKDIFVGMWQGLGDPGPRNDGPRNLMFAIFIVPSLIWSFRISARCEGLIEQRAAHWKRQIFLYASMALVLFLSTITRYKYGDIAVALGHVWLFLFVTGRKPKSSQDH